MAFNEDIRQQLKITLTNEQEDLFEKYFNKLIEFNKHTNLTTITDKKDVYYKHFFDSLTIKQYILIEDGAICDMGSGAGFPSIPLKIILPNLKVTIIDSSNKRIKFLTELVEELKLDNITLVHSRIEDYAIKNQKSFDYVTARALGNLTLITELGVPMLKVGGEFIAMKGSKGKEELVEAKNAIKVTGAKVVSESYLYLPEDYGERSIYIIKKEKHTNGYPRSYQQILKQPL